MPQLDFISFVSQIFWLLIVFFSFYIVIFKNILPALAFLLKVRSKKIQKSHDLVSIYLNEQKDVNGKYDSLVSKSSKNSASFLVALEGSKLTWVNNSNSSSKQAWFSNTNYLFTLFNLSVQKVFVKSFLFF